ncbi:polar amino acid ABC transporter ATP-binding protein [Salmonella enterica subsp. enterica]|uniref:Polar amino acid ABC transporter ATP-binding protein n=1 Tax=Salmonella enterica I TaxID=59201 RepID=A0A447U2X2_SALET|nr:polar amino acid ABC transporter ATP-binding protein [Salmonella enterica subsp. enterica]
MGLQSPYYGDYPPFHYRRYSTYWSLFFGEFQYLFAVFLVYFGLPSIGIYVSPLVAMNLSVGLISGSYLAEVFRGALKLVEPYEITVAKVAGMRQLQVIINIELPQMLRFSVPGIINEFFFCIKSDALCLYCRYR